MVLGGAATAAVGPTIVAVEAKAKPPLMYVPEVSPLEDAAVAMKLEKLLNRPVKLVHNWKYTWMDKIAVHKGRTVIFDDVERHNYTQIVRTPGRIEEKDWLLKQHAFQIEHVLQLGRKLIAGGGALPTRTQTGGMDFWAAAYPRKEGYVVGLRRRILVWSEYETEFGNPVGEWLSDVGWRPTA